MSSPNHSSILRVFFFAAALEAGAAVFALARIPSEGLSLARLSIFAFLGFCTFAGLYLALRPPMPLVSAVPAWWIYLSGLLAFLAAVALFFLRYLGSDLLPVFERLSPLLRFLLVFFIQACLFLLFMRRGFHPTALRPHARFFRLVLGFFVALLLVLLFISITRLGVTHDPAYWGEPGVPLMGWQFALALLGGLLAFLFPSPPFQSSRRLSILLGLSIYLLAVALWLSLPMELLKNGFYVSIDPPVYQPFPYSDSGYYDTMAQSLLIGHPYRGEIPTRPLYIVFLAFLHLLFGQRYDLVLVGQTLALAFIPVLLYLLGQKIHSRAAGVTAALIFIFREFTSILITSDLRVSNTRTLLVDLPTLMLVLIACLFALRWLERRDVTSALLAGGSMGVLLLLRTQAMLMIPALLLLAGLVFGLRYKPFYLLSAFFLIGLFLAISPWLLHNYLESGRVNLDANFQYEVLATQYAYTGNLDIGTFDFAGKGLGQILLEFTLKDPGFVFGFILNHFLAGWVGGLLALPLFQTYNGVFEPVNLYWASWDGQLSWPNLALVILYLGVIALGLAACWRRWRWTGLLPLFVNIGYMLATAVGRFSGWRYDFPADWVPYFYFSVGFAELLYLLALLFGSKISVPVFEPPSPRLQPHLSSLVIPALVFMFLGGLPWIATSFASPRYADGSPQALVPALSRLPGAPPQADIEAFLSGPDAVLTQGRLLYPRFFPRGNGMSSTRAWPAYATRDFARQGFVLLNQTQTHALFPTRDHMDFPPGADAILLGCRRDGYIEVRLIAFPASSASYLSAPLSQGCASGVPSGN